MKIISGGKKDYYDYLVAKFQLNNGHYRIFSLLFLFCCNIRIIDTVCTIWQIIYRFTGYFHPRPPMDYLNLCYKVVT